MFIVQAFNEEKGRYVDHPGSFDTRDEAHRFVNTINQMSMAKLRIVDQSGVEKLRRALKNNSDAFKNGVCTQEDFIDICVGLAEEVVALRLEALKQELYGVIK